MTKQRSTRSGAIGVLATQRGNGAQRGAALGRQEAFVVASPRMPALVRAARGWRRRTANLTARRRRGSALVLDAITTNGRRASAMRREHALLRVAIGEAYMWRGSGALGSGIVQQIEFGQDPEVLRRYRLSWTAPGTIRVPTCCEVLPIEPDTLLLIRDGEPCRERHDPSIEYEQPCREHEEG
eukprot:CAMPEP_0180644858 /NCGR_PEP_ID=MMETSP1037_2-20121125/48643_1 /TAXON_ID=632150 /ORGANISM="Azadinium spinosum, Strain 3D9" /LENGTH=182 /DNA_ID=CAMNT_0022668603 /DNA_START=64 /DNA_END=613 /DNA_ORIENTATION=+